LLFRKPDFDTLNYSNFQLEITLYFSKIFGKYEKLEILIDSVTVITYLVKKLSIFS